MTGPQLNTLIQKAIKKGDGVGKQGSTFYAAKNGRLVFFYEGGNVFQFSHGFLVKIGPCESWNAEKELKRMLKEESNE